ncbi:enolase C-terminal domain-like protein [Fangia hongkongensis]|uniref:enolase C-terminal domain-like protein n=2 Tax=Fangia hongkongensis TaxID=270495 RepID=UPI00035C127A|nr:enolase C-terminal domain-like protein [Fangia hongkongensis]
MDFVLEEHYLAKITPLVISREVIKGQNNLFVKIKKGKHVGIGESVILGDMDESKARISQFLMTLDSYMPVPAYEKAKAFGLNAREIALVDLALWDLLAKEAKKPLYELLGLEYKAVDTSITVSIGKPEWVYQRTLDLIVQYNPKLIKVKLGAKEGIKADKLSFQSVISAIKDSAKSDQIEVFVDANGGWSLENAKEMMSWLKQYDIAYVEQPLAEKDEHQLPLLYQDRVLPIFIDESCKFASDVARLHQCIDGVNIKLLKCGGITEGLRIIHCAKAHGLKTMIGCFGETEISISGAASLTPLLDYVDLDSFMNLDKSSLHGFNSQLYYKDGELNYTPVCTGHGVEYVGNE